MKVVVVVVVVVAVLQNSPPNWGRLKAVDRFCERALPLVCLFNSY